GRGAHGRLDGSRAADTDPRARARTLLVALAPVALAQGGELGTFPARRRRLRRLRSRHAPRAGAPGRRRLPHGGPHVLLHASARRPHPPGAPAPTPPPPHPSPPLP